MVEIRTLSDTVLQHQQRLGDAASTYTDTSMGTLLLKTIAYALLITLFGPLIVSAASAFLSASVWLFWLIMSMFFSVMQLLFVLYQFAMVSVDIFGLILLKSFAATRALVLYFGINVRWLWRKGASPQSYSMNRPRSRRRWRIQINKCKDYDEFTKVEIEEPKVFEDDERPLTTMNAIRVSHQQFLSNVKFVEKVVVKKAIGLSRRLHLIGPNKEKLSKRSRSDGLNRSEGSLNTLGSKDITSPKKPDQRKLMKHTRSSMNLQRDVGNKALRHVEELLGITGGMLLTTTSRLSEAREAGDVKALKYLLTGVVKRNHLSIDDILNEDGRSIAERGRAQLPSEAMKVVMDYVDEVMRCLEWISDISNIAEDEVSDIDENDFEPTDTEEKKDSYANAQDISDRLKIIRNLKHNTGCTALMLSGGGAITMYHLGVIKGLVESGVYEQIPVVSGTSGGSISAAMCAVSTPEELLKEICVKTISTDYPLGTGTMKKENIRWFPKVTDMGAYWLKTKRLVDSREFKRTCDHYWGDITFEEAFQRTGKHVCIHVSASRAGAGGGAQRLLLNHISTPHVTVASAVSASCALPGVMKPTTLFIKDSEGNLEPFAVDGVEWIDGSVQADLPFRRISTLFNVSNFIVSQVNFHVVPLLNKSHHPSIHSYYWKLFQILEWDIRNRALNLSRLGLFPKLFGQDISKVFKQKYHGNITIVPRFTKMSTFGLNALLNPTVEDMKIYLHDGQVATWPYINAIKHNLRLEQKLIYCLDKLEGQARAFHPSMLRSGSFRESSVDSFDRPQSNDAETNELRKTVENLQSLNSSLTSKVEELEIELKRLSNEKIKP